MASLLFGATVEPERRHRRDAAPGDAGAGPASDPAFAEALHERSSRSDAQPSRRTTTAFVADPLVALDREHASAWPPRSGTGRLVRARAAPDHRAPSGAAAELAELTGVAEELLRQPRSRTSSSPATRVTQPDTGFPVFAFRLHQFISRGDTVYASLEPEDERYLTVHPQQFVPGRPRRGCSSRSRSAASAARSTTRSGCVEDDGGATPRAARASTRRPTEDGRDGRASSTSSRDALALTTPSSRPLPEDWLEARRRRPRSSTTCATRSRRRSARRARRTRRRRTGMAAHFVPAPFRFCLRCGVVLRRPAAVATSPSSARSARRAGARRPPSSSLSAVRHLAAGDEPCGRRRASCSASPTTARTPRSRPATSTTSSRSGCCARRSTARPRRPAPAGLTPRRAHAAGLRRPRRCRSSSTPRTRRCSFAALHGDPERPCATSSATASTATCERGWRITSPEPRAVRPAARSTTSRSTSSAAAEDVWAGCHPALAAATPEQRANGSASALLDFMRRELAIKVDYLERELPGAPEPALQPAPQAAVGDRRERAPRARGDRSSRARSERDDCGGVRLPLASRRLRPVPAAGRARSPSSGKHLHAGRHRGQIIQQLLEGLRVAGLVERVRRAGATTSRARLPAAGGRAALGGRRRDRRLPRPDPRPQPAGGGQPAQPVLRRLLPAPWPRTARASRPASTRPRCRPTAREEREERVPRGDAARSSTARRRWSSASTSPSLNVVNLRNVPPTPANYAQRSGRAGRSGQPALVFTYCSTGSPHDQYFFRRPRADGRRAR